MNDKAPSKKEEFLLLRIRAFGDKSAFGTLVNEHGSSLLRFLHFKLPTREDAEDAYSTVLLQLWEYLTRTEVKHFSGLMFTVARAVVAAFYEKRSRSVQVSMEKEDGTPRPIASRESVERTQAAVDVQLLEKGMRALNDNERQMVIMRHLEGYRVKEIAKQLGTTENTVSVTIHHALKKLKDLYE